MMFGLRDLTLTRVSVKSVEDEAIIGFHTDRRLINIVVHELVGLFVVVVFVAG